MAGVRLANATGAAAGRLLDEPQDVRKLGGVLGETIGLGTADPRVIIGLGLNADWAAADFPAELAGSMTSLRVASNGRPIDLPALFAAFIDRVEARTIALRGGHFDIADWVGRQLTSGRPVRLELPDGTSLETRALGVDAGLGRPRDRGSSRARRRADDPDRRDPPPQAAGEPARARGRGVTRWLVRCSGE